MPYRHTRVSQEEIKQRNLVLHPFSLIVQPHSSPTSLLFLLTLFVEFTTIVTWLIERDQGRRI